MEIFFPENADRNDPIDDSSKFNNDQRKQNSMTGWVRSPKEWNRRRILEQPVTL